MSSDDEFKRMFCCTWEPDPRMEELYDRLGVYYKVTSNMGNREAMTEWREFKEWSDLSGYTHDELHQAKKHCSNIDYDKT